MRGLDGKIKGVNYIGQRMVGNEQGNAKAAVQGIVPGRNKYAFAASGNTDAGGCFLER